MRFRHKRIPAFTVRFATLLTALAIFSNSVTVTGQQAPATALRPGIVIDPVANVAYTMTPEGVAAIDLTSGAKRWTSNVAAKPLAIAGNRLISQVEPKTRTNRLEIAVLDTRERGAVMTRGAVELPAFVRVAIGQTLEGKFETETRVTANSAIVSWRFERQLMRGLVEESETSRSDNARPEAQPAGVQRRAEGALQVDLTTGAVSATDASLATAAAPRRWIMSDAEKIPGTAGTQYESADGRHVMASERVGDERTWAKYRWTVFDRSTNNRVGQFQTHLAFMPFVVRDSILIYETTPYIRDGKEEPAKLRGVNLATGQEVWSVEVRELVYRGPFPP